MSDSFGRTTQVNPPTGPWVSYVYDTLDRLTQVTRGGATTSLSYDLGGRKTQMTDPDMGTWNYAYDALGNLTKQTDAKGQRNCLYYDPLNRLIGKIYQTGDVCPTNPATYAVRYWYDEVDPITNPYAKGQRTRMEDGSGSASWVFDNRGRVTSETKTVTGQGSFRTQWAYNSADLQTYIVYPADNQGNAGEQVYSTYLPQMALKGIGNIQLPTNYVYNTAYDAAGRVRLRQLGLNEQNQPILQTAYQYYDWALQGGRLSSIQAGPLAAPTALMNFTYSYSAVGNVLNIQDYFDAGNTQTQTFTYDDLDRLISASAANGTQGNYGPEQYDYNPTTGNLASKAGVNYTYGDANHKHAVTSLSNGNSYGYDSNGNMTTRTVSGQSYTLGYDAENRMTSVSGAAAASFVYDGDGARVVGVEDGTTTVYIGNYFEWKGSTSTMVKYYYAGAERVAMRTGTADQLWLLGDHLGSTSTVANYDGTIFRNGSTPARQGYKAWGEQRFPAGASPLPTTFRYTGQRESSSLGLYFYGARWYDTYLNRWTSPDSIIPDLYYTSDWDRYTYGSNNPSRFIDPSGHRDVDTGGGAYSELSWVEKLLLRPKDDVIKVCAARFHIKFNNFSTSQMWQAYVAALLVGNAFAQATEAIDSAFSAFNAVYGTVELTMGNCDNCPSPTGGRTYNFNGSYWDIRFNGLKNGMAGVFNIIHEFGHAFDGTFWDPNSFSEYQPSRLAWDFGEYMRDSSGLAFRYGQNDGPTELFADMFLGWVTGNFAFNSAGQARSTWMTTNMVEFLP